MFITKANITHKVFIFDEPLSFYSFLSKYLATEGEIFKIFCPKTPAVFVDISQSVNRNLFILISVLL